MAQHVTEHKSAQKVSDASLPQNAEEIAAKVTMALSALDSRYKENIADYAQELHSCTHKIDVARIELEMLHKQKEPHNNALFSTQKEVEYTLRLLERLSDQWIQKTIIVSELEHELKTLGHSRESDTVLQSRRMELDRLQLEIDDMELTLLKNELEKQNLVLKIEPIERKIDALEKSIRELESEKRYIESSYLHRISQVAPMQSSKLPPAIEDTTETS